MNTQPRHPKCRALPVEPHPDIHFSAMIPRRTVKIKFFLSVVNPVVKAAFMPPSATGESPANAGVARLCGVSPCPVPDTATALPNQVRYQLRYTRIFNFGHDAKMLCVMASSATFSRLPGFAGREKRWYNSRYAAIIPRRKEKCKDSLSYHVSPEKATGAHRFSLCACRTTIHIGQENKKI